MRVPVVALSLLLLASSYTAAAEPVTLGDQETVVFYGDSITEQNLYSAYLETFLASRFPHKQITTYNFGWGGDTAMGGNRRFARDVVPVKPTLVFVNFGMNDGGYRPFEQSIYDSYLDYQGMLADAIAATGAREVLFTTSPVDPDLRQNLVEYNDALARMADGLKALAHERKIPVIDLFQPMLDVQRSAKQANPEFTMSLDSIHPTPVGHLVMAYLAIRRLDAPRSVGSITIQGDGVTGADGATVSNVASMAGGLGFDLELPFVPFYVPPEARPALKLVPFEKELNRFVLRADVADDGDAHWVLTANGATLGTHSGSQLAAGIDLALADAAPWAVAGRQLWEAAQYRWQKHQEAWRYMGIEPSPTMLPGLDTFAPFAAAQRAHADAMGRNLGSLARPEPYHLRLSRLGEQVALTQVALSPTYPFDSAFDRPHPPETDPSSVAWTSAPLEAGRIDLGARYAAAANVVAYARVRLQASAACGLHLSMGSDDGLAVFLDGERVFAHDVYRSLHPGEDEVVLSLTPGRHDVIFKVTQGGGDFGLDVQAQVYGSGSVEQILDTTAPPAPAEAEAKTPTSASTAVPETLQVYATARDTGERLAKRAPVKLAPMPQPDEHTPTVIVDPAKSFQAFVGIGGALTDAAAETFAKLPPERQREVLDAYFDPVKGIGYSLARTHIHSCDFSSESYTYVTDPDPSLDSFSIAHDLRDRVPFIKAALKTAGGHIKLFASPWSPPAWMKTNDDMLHGGKLLPRYRDAWARYFVKFVKAYEQQGIPIWGLTVQNEPMATQTWESCIFTAAEERDFVRDHLGPRLEEAGLDGVKLMIWDHNRGIMYQRAKVVYDDPEASRYVWGTAFHWYTGHHWDNVRITHDAWPGKALLFSEGTPAEFDPATLHDWKWGEIYAESMIRDFNNWAVGWTDWNVLLDQHGGPNHVGNFCIAPIHGNTQTGELTYLSSYWYIGQLSKFVRPGAHRIACTPNDDRLLATAFRNADGGVVVVVLNETDEAIPVQVWIDGESAQVDSSAHSIVTVLR